MNILRKEVRTPGPRRKLPEQPYEPREYVNKRLSGEIVSLTEREQRTKQKYIEVCVTAAVGGELIDAQRARIEDLEGWMRDICAAKTYNECKRLAHEALW